MNKSDFFIRITPDPDTRNEAGAIMTNIVYGIWYRNIVEADGTISSYLPIWNLYFYANSKEEITPIAKMATDSYIDEHLAEGGLYAFARHLKSLGFEPTGSFLDWNKLRKRELFQEMTFKPYKATFYIPEDFGGDGEVEDVRVTQKLEFAY